MGGSSLSLKVHVEPSTFAHNAHWSNTVSEHTVIPIRKTCLPHVISRSPLLRIWIPRQRTSAYGLCGHILLCGSATHSASRLSVLLFPIFDICEFINMYKLVGISVGLGCGWSWVASSPTCCCSWPYRHCTSNDCQRHHWGPAICPFPCAKPIFIWILVQLFYRREPVCRSGARVISVANATHLHHLSSVVLAMFWFGIQTFIGSECVYQVPHVSCCGGAE